MAGAAQAWEASHRSYLARDLVSVGGIGRQCRRTQAEQRIGEAGRFCRDVTRSTSSADR
jgi:hypothetical protein